MKMVKYVAAVAAMTAGVASASISLEANFAQVLDAEGAAIARGQTWALIVDVDGDGLAGVANGVADSFVIDSGDYLVDYGSIANSWNVAGVIQTGVSESFDFATYGGMDWYVAWFDVAAGVDAPGANVDYGVKFADITTPTGDNGLAAYANYMDTVSANYQTIPEPATIGLMSIAGLGAYFNRKRLLKK